MTEPVRHPGWPQGPSEPSPDRGRGCLLRLLWMGSIWWATFVLFGLVIAWADISIQEPPDPDSLLQLQVFGVIWILGMIGWIVAIRRVGRRNTPR